MTATTKLHQARLASVLSSQHDVISRGQALDCGMTEKTLRHRIRPDGPWRPLLRGVYVAHTGVPGPDQRDMAALLYAGPGSAITGIAALWRFGLQVPRPAGVDVLVPATCKRMSSGFVRLYRCTRVPGRQCVSGAIRFVLPARAVADAARHITSLREVRAVVAGAVQQQWCSLTDLSRELGAPRGALLYRPRSGHRLEEVSVGPMTYLDP